MKYFKVYLVLSLFFCLKGFGQEKIKDKEKKELIELQESYSEKLKELKNSKKTIENDALKNPKDLVNEIITINQVQKDLKDIRIKAELLIDLYKEKGFKYIDIDQYFNISQLVTNEDKVDFKKLFDTTTAEVVEPNEYLLISPKKVVKMAKNNDENSLINILQSGINEISNTHFGTFIIPKDEKNIQISDSRNNSNVLTQNLKFKRVDIELHEGSVVDIRVFLNDSLGRQHIFTNRTPISFLNFHHTANLNYLSYANKKTNYSKDYENYKVRVSDVIQYQYSNGGNYVPNDIAYSFPVDLGNEQTNIGTEASYKVIQSTALNNIIDFRVYTDLLGLGDKEENGLASVEAQATFYLNTINLTNSNVYLFKKVKPFVAFSRFENEDEFVELSGSLDVDSPATFKSDLEVIQKATFRTGLDLDLVTFKIFKASPFTTSLFTAARYQSSQIKNSANNATEQYTTLGLGGGARIELKRFKNFALTYTIDWMDYRADGLNEIEGLQDPKNFVVLGNQFEASWFPETKKNNSLFVRLRTFTDRSPNADGHFFQAELGYRFSLDFGTMTSGN